MSNIYEALQQAQSEKKAKSSPVQDPEKMHERVTPPTQPDIRKTWHTTDVEMFSLCQNIEYLLPHAKEKIIQFIGSREGEGVSTIVRRFAHAAITTFGKRVLIIDAAHQNPSQHIHYNVDGKYGWKDALNNGEPLTNACFQAGAANLFISPLSFQTALTPQIHDRNSAVNIFDELKQIYQLIIIDSSPATTCPESLALSRYSDGVILVVEAENTRWQMAESVKDKIGRSGGNLLGVIFNKRKYYIPEPIYKML